MKRNGATILMECLLEQQVDTVFGYPGGAVLNIYDALYAYRDRIRHVMTAHEQGAAMRRTDTPGLPAGSACASPPPALAPPIW